MQEFGLAEGAQLEHADLGDAGRRDLPARDPLEIGTGSSPRAVAQHIRPTHRGQAAGDVVTDFVDAPTDGRADPRAGRRRIEALERFAHDARDKTTPTGVHRTDALVVGEQDRHTIRRHHGQRQPAPSGDQRIAASVGPRSRVEHGRRMDLLQVGRLDSGRKERRHGVRTVTVDRSTAADEETRDILEALERDAAMKGERGHFRPSYRIDSGREADRMPRLDATGRHGPGADRRAGATPGGTSCDETGIGRPVIELHGVTKRYPGGQVGLDDVTLTIDRGQLVFLTGPSGAGKTTFLKLIYREEMATDGSILVNGRNVSSLPAKKIPFLRRTIGVVFQSFRLIPRKTVFENVAYLPRILGFEAKEQKRLAYETLRRVGLAHRMNAFPMQLSGGEQQRVAIARALINRPEILLADEPTGNLDPLLSEDILRLFLEINLQGTTVVFATHDRGLIERVGRRVLTLEAGRLVDDRMLEGQLLPHSAGPPSPPDDTDPVDRSATSSESVASGGNPVEVDEGRSAQ